MNQLDETVRQILNNFRYAVLPAVRDSLVRRDLSLGKPLRPAVGNLVKVVTGMRRSGKTFRLYQEMCDLVDAGVDPRAICYFNFDDDRIRPYPDDIIELVLETFFETNPVARSDGAYLFFDEVQDVPRWDMTARRIVDTERVTMYLTGSSSRLLSEDIATEFRGRSVSYELSPFSFREFVRSEGLSLYEHDELDDKRVVSTLRNAYERYLLEGGFPGVRGLGGMERVQALQSYVQFTVSRDIVERQRYPNAAFVSGLARSVVASSARDFSISRAHNQGVSHGYSPGREQIGAMLEAMEDAHLAYGLYAFTRTVQRNRLGGFKVYAVDTGLFHAVAPATSDGVTRALETAVYLELRRRRVTGRQGEISMLKLPSGKEVDFIWGDEAFGVAYELVQVCLAMGDGATRRRELSALDEALERFPDARALVVTRDESGVEHLPHGDVRIIPAWRWGYEAGLDGR